ncbi:hypothetical protein ACN08N_27875 (plasmid) [Photobacterium leiognathi subsp. mandapamensis]|uniref:hypothetical protein n=1 Tax=Vibrionaceae TaxID=641 RepID=UPI0028066D35|nr:hypothetical protein [Vibrio parahaemolyticus]ELA7074210.1 hypothetical protein [Vibrio parahaemolyticus]
MFDLFNKSKVLDLEKKLKLAYAEIESLKTDLSSLEKENDGLKVALGRNKKVAERVKSSSSTMVENPISDNKQPKERQAGSSTNHCSNVGTALVTGVVVGTLLASSDNSSSDNDDSDSSVDE